MNSNFSRRVAFVLPLFVSYLLAFWYYATNLDSQGIFVYALDDPYIHLAIAKNFAFNGVWGITSQEFASASSSPLWTLLLAIGLKISGPNLVVGSLWPLFFNFISSLLLVWVIWRESLRYLSAFVSTLALIIILVSLPLATLFISGQEHILHCAVIFLLVAGYAKVLSHPDSISKRSWNSLVFLTAIGGLVRYESLFLTLVFALLLLWQKRLREACFYVAVSATPLIIFGLISMWQGWPPVPNSIWLKASGANSFFSLAKYETILRESPDVYFYLFSILILLFLLQYKSKSKESEPFANDLSRKELKNRCALIVGIFVLHSMFARFGWLFRYEAYLLFASYLVFLPLLSRISLNRKYQSFVRCNTILLFVFCLVGLAGSRSISAYVGTINSLHHIRDQQWQMARFFKNQFPQASLAANDIGAIAYLRDSPMVDLIGLANLDVAKSRREKKYNSEAIRRITSARKVEFVAVYPTLLGDEGSAIPTEVAARITSGTSSNEAVSSIPKNWIRCAEWDLQNSYFLSKVAFYATSPQSAIKLRSGMGEFAKSLPKREICTIIEADGKRRRAN